MPLTFLQSNITQWLINVVKMKAVSIFPAETTERSSHYSSDTQWTGFESAQDTKLCYVKWICAVVITTTPPCQVSVIFLSSIFVQKYRVKQSSISVWGNYLSKWTPQRGTYFYNFWNFGWLVIQLKKLLHSNKDLLMYRKQLKHV